MSLSSLADPTLTTAERRALESTPGVIFDVQRFSLHDGPGLRTDVFFKGCSLHCAWCCNPESQRPAPELSVFVANCIGCGECVHVCPQRALSLVGGRVVRNEEVCDQCGLCETACPAGALRMIGRTVTAGQVLHEVLRDAAFYAPGSGGLTLTGGEPTLQPEFAAALLRLAKVEGLHTALETCGQASWSVFESLLPYLDLVLYDVKHMDPQQHRLATGSSNECILDNVRRLVAVGTRVILRMPLIPGLNTEESNLQQVAAFAAGLGIQEVHVLPYHALGKPKYRALGRGYMLDEITPMKNEQAETLADVMRAYGLQVQVGG